MRRSEAGDVPQELNVNLKNCIVVIWGKDSRNLSEPRFHLRGSNEWTLTADDATLYTRDAALLLAATFNAEAYADWGLDTETRIVTEEGATS